MRVDGALGRGKDSSIGQEDASAFAGVPLVVMMQMISLFVCVDIESRS